MTATVLHQYDGTIEEPSMDDDDDDDGDDDDDDDDDGLGG